MLQGHFTAVKRAVESAIVATNLHRSCITARGPRKTMDAHDDRVAVILQRASSDFDVAPRQTYHFPRRVATLTRLGCSCAGNCADVAHCPWRLGRVSLEGRIDSYHTDVFVPLCRANIERLSLAFSAPPLNERAILPRLTADIDAVLPPAVVISLAFCLSQILRLHCLGVRDATVYATRSGRGKTHLIAPNVLTLSKYARKRVLQLTASLAMPALTTPPFDEQQIFYALRLPLTHGSSGDAQSVHRPFVRVNHIGSVDRLVTDRLGDDELAAFSIRPTAARLCDFAYSPGDNYLRSRHAFPIRGGDDADGGDEFRSDVEWPDLDQLGLVDAQRRWASRTVLVAQVGHRRANNRALVLAGAQHEHGLNHVSREFYVHAWRDRQPLPSRRVVVEQVGPWPLVVRDSLRAAPEFDAAGPVISDFFDVALHDLAAPRARRRILSLQLLATSLVKRAGFEMPATTTFVRHERRRDECVRDGDERTFLLNVDAFSAAVSLPPVGQRRVVFVQAPCNSGKTHLAAYALRSCAWMGLVDVGLQALVVAPSVALCDSLKARVQAAQPQLTVKLYSEARGDDLRSANIIVCCINSLYKIAYSRDGRRVYSPAVLIIDELAVVNQAVLCGDHMSGRHAQAARALTSIAASARLVVAMDKDVGLREQSLLALVSVVDARTAAETLEPVPPREFVELVVTDDEPIDVDVGSVKLVQSLIAYELSEGGAIAAFVPIPSRARALATALVDRGVVSEDEVTVLEGDTPLVDKRLFSSDPDAFIEANNTRLLIYTSTLSVGVSIEIRRFTRVVVFDSQIHSWRTVLQAQHRCRNVVGRDPHRRRFTLATNKPFASLTDLGPPVRDYSPTVGSAVHRMAACAALDGAQVAAIADFLPRSADERRCVVDVTDPLVVVAVAARAAGRIEVHQRNRVRAAWFVDTGAVLRQLEPPPPPPRPAGDAGDEAAPSWDINEPVIEAASEERAVKRARFEEVEVEENVFAELERRARLLGLALPLSPAWRNNTAWVAFFDRRDTAAMLRRCHMLSITLDAARITETYAATLETVKLDIADKAPQGVTSAAFCCAALQTLGLLSHCVDSDARPGPYLSSDDRIFVPCVLGSRPGMPTLTVSEFTRVFLDMPKGVFAVRRGKKWVDGGSDLQRVGAAKHIINAYFGTTIFSLINEHAIYSQVTHAQIELIDTRLALAGTAAKRGEESRLAQEWRQRFGGRLRFDAGPTTLSLFEVE